MCAAGSDCPCMLARSGLASLLMCNGPWTALVPIRAEPGTKEMEAVFCGQENCEHPAIQLSAQALLEKLQQLLKQGGKVALFWSAKVLQGEGRRFRDHTL